MEHTRDDMYRFKLYIAGDTPLSERAVSSLRGLLEDELKDQYFLEIIDVIKDPEAAESDRIFATPTMVKTHPPPVIRIIGDLSNKEQIWLVVLEGYSKVLH